MEVFAVSNIVNRTALTQQEEIQFNINEPYP